MKLYYIGPSVAEVGVVPLPEGWPAAAEHDEPDAAIAKEKLEFKLDNGKHAYTKTAPKDNGPATGEGE